MWHCLLTQPQPVVFLRQKAMARCSRSPRRQLRRPSHPFHAVLCWASYRWCPSTGLSREVMWWGRRTGGEARKGVGREERGAANGSTAHRLTTFAAWCTPAAGAQSGAHRGRRQLAGEPSEAPCATAPIRAGEGRRRLCRQQHPRGGISRRPGRPHWTWTLRCPAVSIPASTIYPDPACLCPAPRAS